MFKKLGKILDVVGYIILLIIIITLAYQQKIKLSKIIDSAEMLCLELVDDILFLKQLGIQDTNDHNLSLLGRQFKYFIIFKNDGIYQFKLAKNINDLPVDFTIKVNDSLLNTNQNIIFAIKSKNICDNIYYHIFFKPIFLLSQIISYIALVLLAGTVIFLGKFKLRQLIFFLEKNNQFNNNLILQKLLIHEKLTKIFLENIIENEVNVFSIVEDCISYFSVESNSKKINICCKNENISYKLGVSAKMLYTIIISVLYKVLITMPKKSLVNISFYVQNRMLHILFTHNGFKFNEKQFFRYSDVANKNSSIWLVNTSLLLKLLSENGIEYHFTTNEKLNIFTIKVPLYESSESHKTQCQILQFNSAFKE